MREFGRTMARRRSDSPLILPSPARAGPDFRLEADWRSRNPGRIAGVDEAGRGPLAGPVVAAAVILDPMRIPNGLDDSKKLTARGRERLFSAIVETSAIGIASASAAEIDRLNIRQATLLAMRRAVAALPVGADHCLIDGLDVPPALAGRATPVVSGDALSLSIAAASIIAKVMRDRMMAELDRAFPAYGFGRHMGYGTARHLEALREVGPCLHHRRSFAPVRATLDRAGPGVV